MKRIIISCFLLFLSVGIAKAQTHVVYGIVNTFDSIPLIGVEVFVKGTKQTLLTDSLGRFSAICKDNDKLKIRAKGFVSQNVKITKDLQLAVVNLKMQSGQKGREYAIGYGYMSEKDRSTAIANLKSGDTNFNRFSNMYDLLQSMGAEVENGEVILRGPTSFQGSSAALIVVDDVIVESSYLNGINPIEVKSIDIIKDGSAAVYGSRGANGVVLIKLRTENK
ncbi:TonB-dependent receptor plug domain-containing protein [Prolixibacteraceae bacterium Z1-6]|uniref:TonB-dependent receptor plug domain-containing protein n=1 Tax=Draconibacterium aestuarii TaxID=2998507 RepID=A0A9X3F3C4_9BACT|nr:TonB-dependent receptor plug domain-containing protein [Prolixibacteraceae bacterium Z1-6]